MFTKPKNPTSVTLGDHFSSFVRKEVKKKWKDEQYILVEGRDK